MENLGWDNNNIPSVFRNASEITIPPTTTTIYSNYQYDNLSAGSDTDYSPIINSKAELNESFLINSSFEQLQRDLINVDRINEVVEMLAPAFDSMNNSLDLELLQQGQDAVRLAADSFVSSHHYNHHQLVSFPATATATARPKIALDSLGSPTENFGTYQELCILTSAKNDDGATSVTFPSFRSDNIYSNNNNLSSSGNFSSSSEGSSQAESSKNRRNCKRKLDDRHSSEYLPLSTSSTSTERGGGFQIFFDKSPKSKKPRSEKESSLSSNIDFRQESGGKGYEPDTEAIAQVKEMIYRAAAMRPVSLVLEEAVETPKRKNVKISSDPQTVAARHRRERISKRLRVLQKLVPGGSKMDTASMLDEAANYLKFLKSQVTALETLGTSSNPIPFPFTQQQQQQQQAFPMQSTPLFAHHPRP